MALMSPEDQELFLEMLLKLDGSHESIKAASKWCRANAAQHQDIVRMWFFAVAKSRTMTRRLDLFHLASDILFTVDAGSIVYFSSFLPQLVKAIPFVRGEEIKVPMKKLFTLWREKNIFNRIVMDRLEKSLRNRNRVIDSSIFRYDRDLLFKNLRRVQELLPACDYLMVGMENSPNFENSQALLGTIKERRACQSLLAAVDAHKTRMTSLVTYMEEMVHLLKMATTALDLAGNKEQNGVEETKLKIVAYGRYGEKVLSLSHRLESIYHIDKKELMKSLTPASPDQEDANLYSRRIAAPLTWQPPLPTVALGAMSIVEETADNVFHRRDVVPMTPVVDVWASTGISTPRRDEWEVPLSGTPRRDDGWPELPLLPLPATLQDPPLAKVPLTPQRDVEPWPAMSNRSQISTTPLRENDDLFPLPPHRPSELKLDSWSGPSTWKSDAPRGSSTPRRDDDWASSWERRSAPVNRNWDRRSSTPSQDEWKTQPSNDWPRRVPTPLQDEWPGERQSTPTRVEPWSPASPSYGAPSWGSSNSERKPVYMPRFTGVHHHDSDDPSKLRANPLKLTPRKAVPPSIKFVNDRPTRGVGGRGRGRGR